MSVVASIQQHASTLGFVFDVGTGSSESSDLFFASMIMSEPETGELEFEMPDDFITFLDAYGHASLSDAESVVVFEIGTEIEFVMDLGELTFVPDGVSWETQDGNEVPIATHHLVPFALGDGESVWCFDTSSSPYKVVQHRQDEPMHARHRESGEALSLGEDGTPVFSSFTEWLAHIDKRLGENPGPQFSWT